MKLLVGVLVLSFGFLNMSCAHRTEKELTRKVAQEAPVEDVNSLSTTSALMIQNSQYTPQQKMQLQELQMKSSRQMQALREESLKLRSVLIKDVFAEDYNRSEVRLIQKKIKKVEGQRVALMFDTIDRTNAILGRLNRGHEAQLMTGRIIGEHSEY